MFNLDEILQQKFASPQIKYAGAEQPVGPERTQPANPERKQRKDNFTKVEPYEYGSISVGDYIKYISKNGELKGGTVRKIQLADDNFEFDLARGTHYWRINNNNAKEIRIKYAKAPTKSTSPPKVNAPFSSVNALSSKAAASDDLLRRIEKLEEDNRRLAKMLSVVWQKIKDQH